MNEIRPSSTRSELHQRDQTFINEIRPSGEARCAGKRVAIPHPGYFIGEGGGGRRRPGTGSVPALAHSQIRSGGGGGRGGKGSRHTPARASAASRNPWTMADTGREREHGSLDSEIARTAPGEACVCIVAPISGGRRNRRNTRFWIVTTTGGKKTCAAVRTVRRSAMHTRESTRVGSARSGRVRSSLLCACLSLMTLAIIAPDWMRATSAQRPLDATFLGPARPPLDPRGAPEQQ